MPDAKPLTGAGKGARAVRRAVVGHDALHADAGARQPRHGAADKAPAGGLALIGQHLHIGNARGVVHTHVHVLPPGAPGAGAPIAGDAMADSADAAELLDVDMEQLARPRPLVPLHGRGRLQGRETPQAPALHPAPHRAGRHADGGGNARNAPALPPQRRNSGQLRRRGDPGQPVGPARAIAQPAALRRAVPRQPFLHRSHRHPGPLGHPRRALPAQHALHHFGSPVRRQSGILMDVHPALRCWVVGCFATTSFPAPGRMNNLFGIHT